MSDAPTSAASKSDHLQHTSWEAISSFAERADALLAESATVRAQALRVLGNSGAAQVVAANSESLARAAAGRAAGRATVTSRA